MPAAAAVSPRDISLRAWRGAVGRSSLRAAVLGGSAAVLAFAQTMDSQHRLFVCPLREITGIPCPFCGGTTAAISVARFDLGAGLAANPVAIVAAIVVVLAPLLVLTRIRLPAGRRQLLAICGALALSELWQLARFSLVS